MFDYLKNKEGILDLWMKDLIDQLELSIHANHIRLLKIRRIITESIMTVDFDYEPYQA